MPSSVHRSCHLLSGAVLWTQVLLAAGCVRFLSNTTTSRQDGAVDRAQDVQPRREQTADGTVGPFGRGSWSLGPASKVSDLDLSSSEGDLFLTADGLTAYFGMTYAGGLGGPDIHRASRTSRYGAFDPPVNFTEVNTSSSEWAFVMTADGLQALLSSDRVAGVDFEILMARRTSAAVPWSVSAFAAIPAISSPAGEHDPCLSPDGLRLYFKSGKKLVVSQRATLADTFGAPSSLVANVAEDSDPTLSPDERVLVFSSDRPGGLGGFDLWYAVRPARSAAFSAPQLVPGVNTDGHETEPLITADGSELYFASCPVGKWDSSYYRVRIDAGP